MLATVAIVVLIFVIIALFVLHLPASTPPSDPIRSYKRRLGTIAEVVEQTAQVRTSQLHTLARRTRTSEF